MLVIDLDATGWSTEEDFYRALLPRLAAPDWHGHNLDALHESIRDRDINAVNVPYRIVITGASNASDEVQKLFDRFRQVIKFTVEQEGTPVELEISD